MATSEKRNRLVLTQYLLSLEASPGDKTPPPTLSRPKLCSWI